MVTFLTFFFFFNDTATTEIYTLSLHDALPISLINNHHRSLVTDPPPIAIPISIPITFAYNSTPMAPPSDDSDMRLASELHRQGRLADAERVYRRILARQPDHVDATHMMGVLAGQGRRSAMAVELFRRTIQLKPDFAAAHYHLGNALQELGRFDEAVVAYSKAIELSPGFIEALVNLGQANLRLGRFEDAIAANTRVLKLKPDLAVAHLNLAH